MLGELSPGENLHTYEKCFSFLLVRMGMLDHFVGIPTEPPISLLKQQLISVAKAGIQGLSFLFSHSRHILFSYYLLVVLTGVCHLDVRTE